MNSRLHGALTTGGSGTDSTADPVDPRTIRRTGIHKETQLTRSPSEVFVFGEENSWAINTEGQLPMGPVPLWAVLYNLSGKYYSMSLGKHGTIGLPGFEIETTYRISNGAIEKQEHYMLGDAFATYHRPPVGEISTPGIPTCPCSTATCSK